MRNILITGASGSLGSLARMIFSNDSVTLISRRQILVGDNEVWHKSEDLNNFQWWESFVFKKQYDLVLHFAEPVKSVMSDSDISNIVRSHVGFIASARKHCERVIYPLTAYCYDARVKKSAQAYVQIKKKVHAALQNEEVALFPIFHPLIDYGDGLAKLITMEKMFPIVNLFYCFDARLPVLTRRGIEKFLIEDHRTLNKKCDVYSNVASVSELFASAQRGNSQFISGCFKVLCRCLTFLPEVQLLISGRDITSSQPPKN